MNPIEIALTQAQFAAAKEKLLAQGIAIQGKSGQVTHWGVLVSWSYDGALLTVRVLHRPFLVPMSSVESKIRGWFAAA